jgi:hypothetical protein
MGRIRPFRIATPFAGPPGSPSGRIARPGWHAHSGDLERSIRSIMNTESGDHEHLLAAA